MPTGQTFQFQEKQDTGRYVGDVIEVADGRQPQRLRIETMSYQPEAAAARHL